MFRNLNSNWSLLPGPFCFWKILSIERDWVPKKMKLPFSRLFDNLLSKYLTLKQFLACNGCFRLFIKIIKRSGTNFCCKFSAWFFYKNVLYLILHLLTRFHCHTFFPSQDIKQNVLFSSYLDNWWIMNFKIYLRSSSKAMTDR